MLPLATFIIGGLIGFFICAALCLARHADEAIRDWPEPTGRHGFPHIGPKGFGNHRGAEIATTVRSASPDNPPVPGRDGSRGRG